MCGYDDEECPILEPIVQYYNFSSFLIVDEVEMSGDDATDDLTTVYLTTDIPITDATITDTPITNTSTIIQQSPSIGGDTKPVSKNKEDYGNYLHTMYILFRYTGMTHGGGGVGRCSPSSFS